MRDLIELITILLGLFTLIFGILQYFWQKRFDEKLRVYKNYLEIVSLSTLPPDEQKYLEYLKLINLMRLDLRRFNKKISEETLRKLLG